MKIILIPRIIVYFPNKYLPNRVYFPSLTGWSFLKWIHEFSMAHSKIYLSSFLVPYICGLFTAHVKMLQTIIDADNCLWFRNLRLRKKKVTRPPTMNNAYNSTVYTIQTQMKEPQPWKYIKYTQFRCCNHLKLPQGLIWKHAEVLI